MAQSLWCVPALWVALEYSRSHLLSGFGWNLLAYSQTPWHELIQLADLTGAWGISFLIVLVNCALAALVGPKLSRQVRRTSIILAALCLLVAVGYGTWRLPQLAMPTRTVRVAVVQGNIPQAQKWDETYREKIAKRYETLTREAAQSQPHLIVWPETSTPDYLDLDEETTQRVMALARAVRIPLLVGAPMGRLHDVAWHFTNSAALLDANGRIVQRYDKLHLVPFGEFIPLERTFPWLRNLLPPIGDFVPGREYTVFHLGSGLRAVGSGQNPNPEPRAPSPELRFSVLICFEDVFPHLARRFVTQGAQLLLVITNDAWFGPTAAAYQHAQASTLRAVELRVPIVRAANTGWSGCIDPSGRWVGSVRDARGTELFVPGTQTCDLPVESPNTLYRRWGDWVAGICFILASINLLLIRKLR